MADSNITKRALADAIKALMQEMPFEKIGVAQICERCDMNRKSFYYHFRDKYDLINWIFDTEFIEVITEEQLTLPYEERMTFIAHACDYFYQNRDFYRRALRIKGQNSFSDHFREVVRPLLRVRFLYLLGEDGTDDFVLDFFTDAIICALERWLLDKNCMPAQEFVDRLIKMVTDCARVVQREVRIE